MMQSKDGVMIFPNLNCCFAKDVVKSVIEEKTDSWVFQKKVKEVEKLVNWKGAKF